MRAGSDGKDEERVGESGRSERSSDCEMEQKIGSTIGFWTRGCSVFARIARPPSMADPALCALRIPRNPVEIRAIKFPSNCRMFRGLLAHSRAF